MILIGREERPFAPPMSWTTDFTPDLSGLVLVAAAVAWSYIVGLLTDTDASSVMLLFLAIAAIFVAARLLTTQSPLLVPATVVAVAAAIGLGLPADVLSSEPDGYPFGYANAKGAFFSQAAVAGLMLATGARSRLVGALGVIAAVAFVSVPFITKSYAAGILAVVLLGASVLLARVAGRRLIAVFGLLIVGALVMTILLGFTYSGGARSQGLNRVVDESLTERRVAMWHEALIIMESNLATGVGHGQFEHTSPTARSDQDARRAPSGFLERGAEAGVAAFVLLALLFCWGFARLGSSPMPSRISVLGAAGLAAVGVHSCIDYVLHYPAVPIAAAALLGAAVPAMSRRRSE